MFSKLLKISLLSFVLLTIPAGAQTISQKFAFGINKAKNGYAQVGSSDLYSAEKGYGFEPGASVNCAAQDENSGVCSSDKPFYFSAKVAEGNYKVTVTFGDQTAATETTVKAELRRLMLEKVETRKGKFRTETFIVSVRNPQFPGGAVKLKDREKTMEWWAWDDKLTLEFNGKRPAVNAVEIEKIETLPTVFLLGDSTVCDQPREPYASWGQMLPAFFKPEVAIANHAESGESLKSSFGAKRLDKVLSLIIPGDVVLIQFAHNDEKEKGVGVGAMTTFKASLKQYIAAVRSKSGIPILITPMHRRTFDAGGKITNSHGDYPEAIRQTAKEEAVALIDLSAMSKDFYEALGREKSGVAFKDGDGTHHSNYGAYEIAKMVATSIKKQKLTPARYLVKGFKSFNPKKPDSFEKFAIPASPLTSDIKPLGN